MPANTHAKPMNAVFGNVDVIRCQQEYEKEILSILHIPSKEQQKDSTRQHQLDDGGRHKARINGEGALLSEITLCLSLCYIDSIHLCSAEFSVFYMVIHDCMHRRKQGRSEFKNHYDVYKAIESHE
jgi:hypothetical protein